MLPSALNVRFAPGWASESEHAGPSPLVQPGSSLRPSALDHPPEYHAHDRWFSLRRSPMVGLCCRGSWLAGNVPGANGCSEGWIVLTAQSPHTVGPFVDGFVDGFL